MLEEVKADPNAATRPNGTAYVVIDVHEHGKQLNKLSDQQGRRNAILQKLLMFSCILAEFEHRIQSLSNPNDLGMIDSATTWTKETRRHRMLLTKSRS